MKVLGGKPDLKEPYNICILTKWTKITIGPNIGVSKFAARFMLQIDLAFFDVERIHGFVSIVLAISSSASWNFVFPLITKIPHLDILKFLVSIFSNQYKKVSFFLLDKYDALEISSKFIRTCYCMNVTVQPTVRDIYSLNERR